MTQPDEPVDDATTAAGGAGSQLDPTLAEDLLLLLFQPGTGTIAGENTLYYVLAAAVLADLALGERVATTTTRTGSVNVHAVAGRAPTDELLRRAWEYVADKPRGVQTVLPAVGPALREPVLERLLARGDIGQERRRVMGLFGTTALIDGGNGRRADLLGAVREVLVDGAEPTPRVATLAALIWASGALPQLDPEIPWTSAVIARAQELERGSWGAAAGAEAVTRTMNAIITSSVIVAIAAHPRT
ncbi:GOLPH3/VPS74 family protein [Pseudactinotalea suaedae]|uniref:GOLPH3/VPS74 family protein n=1 Tax=Pseudactinotalea suaedae TaxID=1524924 RepID=UPI0012E164D1|nr:GPP34 family phosphoprotein [Pseudactinotalea suaedae]